MPKQSQPELCKKGFGLTGAAEIRHEAERADLNFPTIIALRHSLANSRARVVTWTVTLRGGSEISVNTATLRNYPCFCRAFFFEHGIHLSPMPRHDWYRLLDAALRPLREARR